MALCIPGAEISPLPGPNAVAIRLAGREPSPDHPYGFHRAVGVGHLVAATALLGMGAFLVWDSATGLVMQEHPTRRNDGRLRTPSGRAGS